MWALHHEALDRGVIPTVPTAVLAQGWRGGPQPLMSRLLDKCRIEPLDEKTARSAGAACSRAGTSDIVDAALVVSASTRGDLVVTSDPLHIIRLSEAIGHKLVLRKI